MEYCRNKNFIEISPLLFPDKLYVAIAYKNVVELHDYQHVVIWKLKSDNTVVSIEISLTEKNKFFIAYKNGTVKICDVLSFSVKDVIQLKTTLNTIFVFRHGIIAAQEDGIYMYSNFDLSLKTLIIKRSFINIAFEDKTGIIAMAERNELLIKKLSGNFEKHTFLNQWKKERHFTCIACHPENNNVATGDTTGQVIIWWNVLDGFNQTSIYHWHFLSLNSVAFNCIGSHLLTGGNEGVFVKWELAVNDSEKSRRFYPRLESQIASVRSFVDDHGEYYLLALADNSYHIITSNLDRINSYYNFIQRSKFLHNKVDKKMGLVPVGLISGHSLPGLLKYSVVTNGHEGKLQFFDLLTNEVRYQLDVTCQNWPTETENALIPGFIQVQKVAVSHCGRNIVTYERLAVFSNIYDHISNLRVFHWASEEEKFTLQAIEPMEFSDQIVDIIFHPSKNEHFAVITKSSKLFLLSRTSHGDNIRWSIVHIVDLAEVLYRFHVCLSHHSHHHRATLSTVSCSHNPSDGILAIGNNASLTLYLWSHLLNFKTQPLIAKDTGKLILSVAMERKRKRAIVPDIVSLAIVNNANNCGRYRIACGLQSGLLLIEVSIGRDGSVTMEIIRAAVSDNNDRCVLSSSPATGSHVAVLFKKPHKLMIVDIWDDSSEGETILVPGFDHITWARVMDTSEGEDKWVVAGLVKHGHNVDLVTCEAPPTEQNLERKKSDFASVGVNLLADVADVTEVATVTKVSRRNKTRQDKIAENKKIRAFTLYQSLDFTVALNSLYQD